MLMRNHTCHIASPRSCEHSPHDSSGPLSVLPWNRTWHNDAYFHPLEQIPCDSSGPLSLLPWIHTWHNDDNLHPCEQPSEEDLDVENPPPALLERSCHQHRSLWRGFRCRQFSTWLRNLVTKENPSEDDVVDEILPQSHNLLKMN